MRSSSKALKSSNANGACCGALVRFWHKAAEAKASNLRQLLGEQRKCMDGRPRPPSTRMTQSRTQGVPKASPKQTLKFS
jgi:hypothetical protein